MRSIFLIRDKDSHKFWTGAEWNQNYSDAKMYQEIDDAIDVAKQLGKDSGQSVEVVDGYEYSEPNVRWSS